MTIYNLLPFFFAFTFSLSSWGWRPGFYFSISCGPGRPLPSNQALPVSFRKPITPPPWRMSSAPLPSHWHLPSLSHNLVFTLSQHVSMPPHLVNLYHRHHTGKEKLTQYFGTIISFLVNHLGGIKTWL